MAWDRRPYLALGGAVILFLIMVALPAGRAFLAEDVLAPLRAQVDPASGAKVGYTLGSMAFWALAGLALAWPAYDLAFARLGYEPDRRFFLGLAPFLVLGPLAHALLVADALPPAMGVLRYAATEPVVYLTTAVLVLVALVGGRAARQPLAVPLAVGLVLLAPLVLLAAGRVDAVAIGQLLVVLLLAVAPAIVLGLLWARYRRGDGFAASAAVVGAHALDGGTTWMVLRDPFGLGFVGFGEKNPVSERLVMMSNGWPFYALKLALPLVLLYAVRAEEPEDRTRAFLLFAVFVLGYGPGASNLLQVLLH